MSINKLTLIGANNKKLFDINKAINAELQISDTKLCCQFVIVPQLNVDVILGNDELLKHKIVIDYGKRIIEIENKQINLQIVEENVNFESDEYYYCKENEFNIDKIELNCDEEYKGKIKGMLYKYERLVNSETRFAKRYTHHIEVKDITHFKIKTYPIPYRFKDDVRKEIEVLLQQGIIETSDTPFINPIVVVKKKNGDIRICLDARIINRCSIPQYEKPISIEAILGRITRGIFSLATILDDQENLMDEQKRKLEQKDKIWIKKLGDTELYAVTDELTQNLATQIHTHYGHIGTGKTWKIYRENYYNKHDKTLIHNAIKKCHLCQLGKEKNKHLHGIPQSNIPQAPRHTIAIDFISNIIPSYNNNKHIFVTVDVYSKYITTHPCRKTNTNTVIRILKRYIQEHGHFIQCIMDNATYFQSTRLKNFLHKHNITPKYTSIRHPQSNVAERYIKEIIKYLRLLVHHEQPTWEEKLLDVEYYINNIPNESTGESPIQIFKNTPPDRPWIQQHHTDYDSLIHRMNERKVVPVEIDKNFA
ncbi:hypothetical protein NQ315_016756 [Exocentrus adspersus]|uniref:RNA-directed DNA polymerase n=1 Tax=Exocentrus adspersus TaxID=1586481 RepID=A0AAV8VDJ4_9CUCU|nr:hypothetical protein NQ315_016756 [Exocentrus adspersus]